MDPKTASPPNAIAYSPEDAATVTGRSRSRIFKAIKDKELTARKDGKATLLEDDELRQWVRSLPTIGRPTTARPLKPKNPAARFPWRDRRAHRAQKRLGPWTHLVNDRPQSKGYHHTPLH